MKKLKSVFIVGTGKCGESFLNKLFAKNKIFDNFDERRPFLQSYYRFIKFNKLKVDDLPFFMDIKKAISKSNKKQKIYMESSSFLVLHMNDLIKKFNSKIIFLIRNPNNVCKELFDSGWYKEKYYKSNNQFTLGYQGISNHFSNKHHNFSRIAPKNNFFFKWNKLDPILKSKWYWDEINRLSLKKIKINKTNNFKIIKIEDLNYEKYLELCSWLGVNSNINEVKFKILIQIERMKITRLSFREKKLLKNFESNIEKQFYPENFDKIYD
jgi:hypothetical protein